MLKRKWSGGHCFIPYTETSSRQCRRGPMARRNVFKMAEPKHRYVVNLSQEETGQDMDSMSPNAAQSRFLTGQLCKQKTPSGHWHSKDHNVFY